MRVVPAATDALRARRVLIIYTVGFAAAFAVRPPFEDHADPKPPAEEMRSNLDSGLGWLLAGVKAMHSSPHYAQ